MRRRLDGLLLCCLIAGGTGLLSSQSARTEFGLAENDVKQKMVGVLANGNLSIYPDKKLFQAANPAARVAFVKTVLGWAKTYCESPAFRADYDRQRAEAKPLPRPSKGTPDERFAQYLADQQKGLENMKQTVAKMTPDMQKQMEGTVKQMEANMERTSRDPKIKAIITEGFRKENEADQKAYQATLAAYDAKFPADPKALIAGRLRQFLNVSKDVAFDAKLVPSGVGRMKFADPLYEAKPSDWKLCYRAGKEPVEAARAFAADWLRQIEGR
jgi:hypothetical protein